MMSKMKILMIHTELCLQALLWERLFYLYMGDGKNRRIVLSYLKH